MSSNPTHLAVGETEPMSTTAADDYDPYPRSKFLLGELDHAQRSCVLALLLSELRRHTSIREEDLAADLPAQLRQDLLADRARALHLIRRIGDFALEVQP